MHVWRDAGQALERTEWSTCFMLKGAHATDLPIELLAKVAP